MKGLELRKRNLKPGTGKGFDFSRGERGLRMVPETNFSYFTMSCLKSQVGQIKLMEFQIRKDTRHFPNKEKFSWEKFQQKTDAEVRIGFSLSGTFPNEAVRKRIFDFPAMKP